MQGELFPKVPPAFFIFIFSWGTFEKVPHTPQNFHTFFVGLMGKAHLFYRIRLKLAFRSLNFCYQFEPWLKLPKRQTMFALIDIAAMRPYLLSRGKVVLLKKEMHENAKQRSNLVGAERLLAISGRLAAFS